jgi:hypothetical protein
MTEHDFGALYAQYPTTIAEMPETFTSRQFILELARQNQTLYIEALYSYRHHVRKDTAAPFMIVHGILAKHLAKYPSLIEQIRNDAPSTDIFGQGNSCSEWKKVG